ncbi:MAG: hypothetical protein N3H84_05075, partial [Candidatus Caldarchaeum sp.]|nr:hypothetical protein [Candidatus Caldarchaeum sp.]
MKCKVCGEPVPYVLLRLESPRCSKGHELGVWVSCGNPQESHVYLLKDEAKCPFCGNNSFRVMAKGTKVKCLH